MSYQLCRTCEALPECVHREGRSDIFLCDEFEGAPPSQTIGQMTPRPPASGASGSSESSGLCSTCGDEATCRFPTSSRSILNCEEHA